MDKVKNMSECSVEKVSGGSLEDLGNMGVRVFDSNTNETIAICKDYGDAVHLAKRHNVSGLGTWGNEWENERREREDREHRHSKIAGFGD